MSAKSFSHFTYADIRQLGIAAEQRQLFDKSAIVGVEPSAWLLETLSIAQHFPKDTEKAKSELIVTPILMELVRRSNYQCAIFSGYNLDVDKSKGLKGHCDFLISRNAHVPYVDAPLFAVVEAKKGDFELGTPQLIAQLHAAYLFNVQQQKPMNQLFGAVTIGSTWRFVQYTENRAVIDTQLYYTESLAQLLGVFQHIFNFYWE